MTSETEPARGLTTQEAAESRQRYGVNVLKEPEHTPRWKEFLLKFSDPLILILLVAGALSVGIAFYEYFGLGQGWTVFFEPIGIFVAILLATGLAFIFEQKANKAFAILNRVNDDEPVEVMRDGAVTTIPRRDVVVGDIVYLTQGCEIPADGKLIEAVTLSVDESSLTGEPLCHKTTDPAQFDPDATYPSDAVMRGTKVMDGHGIMRVTLVGDATEMGKVFEQARIDDTVKTPLNEQLDDLAKLISNASYICGALIIAAQLVQYLGWGHWQSWMIILPIAIFFRIVMKKFPSWGKVACVITIAIAFAVFIAMVAGVFVMLNPGAGPEAWSGLLSHTLQTLMVAVTLIVVSVPEGLPMAVTLSLAFSMSRML
ncbi:MAG: haloacid dehalogenase, partial [Paramuribaculum sp.]|nr:haloacid dehalogenase [Paramuribaculum sp.]